MSTIKPEVRARRKKEEAVKPRRPRVPIIIPNADALTQEELVRAKEAEKQRRKMARTRGNEEPGEFKKTKQELMTMNTSEMVAMAKDTRNITLQALQRKMQSLLDNPEELAKVNIATLATAFGIMFDKGQLMDGMATQNIAISKKVDINMSAVDALAELDKLRQTYTEDNK